MAYSILCVHLLLYVAVYSVNYPICVCPCAWIFININIVVYSLLVLCM